jgi:tight adherence protein B
VRRLGLALLVVALALPAAALGAGEVKQLSSTHFPTIEVTVLAPSTSATPPTLLENGDPVGGLNARNLGDRKSIVLSLDRSRSMDGAPLAAASAAARAFVAAKPPADRIAVTTFSTDVKSLTAGFSTSTTDADSALRAVPVDDVLGTKLYDNVVLASSLLKAEANEARILILVTDGNETRSEADLDGAIAAAREAGVAVYVVAIESNRFNPEPLERLAEATRGAYYGAASPEVLAKVYSSLAEDLERTWQLEYFSSARAGEHLELVIEFPGGDQVTAELTAPGEAPAAPDKASPLLPEFFYTSDWGLPVLAGVVGLLVLIAAAFLLAAPKGQWLKGRLDPHVASARTQALKRHREDRRFTPLAGLFKATESVLGNLALWKRVDRLLQRADIPLKTAEFTYIMFGAGLVFGFLFTLVKQAPWFMAIGVVVGALLPYAFVSYKGRKRLKAFDEQLPDMLVTMAASLKAGHSFRQGIQSVVDEGIDPAAKEFKRVLNETRLGRPMDAALADMATRIGSKNFEFVMSAVTIQRQVGGSLAGLFDMVADTVRQRQQFHRKIRGLTAMGRMSAYTLVGLPFVVGLAIYTINREYMEPLLTKSTGHKLIILMIVMMTIGSLLLKKIVSFKG